MALGTLALSNILYRGANLLIAYINIILLSRILGPVGIGEISLFIVNATLAVFILGGSLEAGLVYFYAGKQIPGSRLVPLIFLLLVLQLAIWVPALGLLEHFSGYHLLSGWMQAGVARMIAVGFVISAICSNYFTALLSGKKAFRILNRAVLTSNGLTLVFITVCALLRHHGGLPSDKTILVVYLLCFLFQGPFMSVAYLYQVYEGGWNTRMIRPDFQKIFHYAKWVYLSNILSFLALRLDFWLVGYFCGKQSLGIYAQAAKVGQLFFILPLVIATTIQPFAIEQREKFAEKMIPFFKLIFWMNLIGGILCCAAAPLLFPGLFGSPFRYSAVCFAWLMPGIFCFSLTNVVTAYFLGIRKLKPVLWESVLCIGCILTGDLIFIPRYQILGASVVSSAGYLICSCYTLYIFLKTTRLKWIDLVRIGKQDLSKLGQTIQSLARTTGSRIQGTGEPL